MKELNAILGLDLNTVSIFDINEEHLISLKNSNYYTQSNFYFWLVSTLQRVEKINDLSAMSYINYLMSYFIFIVLTPLGYEDISFNLALKATRLENKLKYKEWLLIYGTLPEGFISTYDLLNLAEEVLQENPNSQIAATILENF